jgi:integrase
MIPTPMDAPIAVPAWHASSSWPVFPAQLSAVPATPAMIQIRKSEHLDGLGADSETLLFASPRGAPLRYSNFRNEVWRPALERLGLPMVGLHVLRHSAAARLIAAGASPKAVQTILGHGSAAFTLTVYGHLFDADLDDLAVRLDATAARPPRGQDGATITRLASNAEGSTP